MITTKDIVFFLLLLPIAWLFLWLYGLYLGPSGRVARALPSNVPFAAARAGLITALLGDRKAADRLIAHEYARNNCSWLEAAQRALESLERDRSRN